jgi:UDP-glucose 4-epimerase
LSKNNNKILVTGGSGYLGAQICRVLYNSGYEPIIIDHDSKRNWTIKDFTFFNFDFVSADALKIISKFKPDTVLHLAAFHLVEESVLYPSKYYLNNVIKTKILLDECIKHGVKNFIFSGTGGVYGERETKVPFHESLIPKPSNPYTNSKYMTENMLADYSEAYDINYISTRYFNAAGANPEGYNGYTQEPPSHIVPILMRKILSQEKFIINGNDYNTSDGTCIRDYCHIHDIAEGKLAAIKFLENGGESGIINLGSGKGYSIMELIHSAQEITGRELEIGIGPRRPGDVAYLCADISKAEKLLNWKPKLSITDIFKHSQKWIENKSSIIKND